MELATAPAAIFLDEPTSGLDATAALEVCTTLRAIADLGLTVVAVIHQPRLEIFETFDDLLLLAAGGLTAYMGPQRLVRAYFEEAGFRFLPGHNPADDLLDFLAGKGGLGGDAADAAAGGPAGAGGGAASMPLPPAFASPTLTAVSSLNGGGGGGADESGADEEDGLAGAQDRAPGDGAAGGGAGGASLFASLPRSPASAFFLSGGSSKPAAAPPSLGSPTTAMGRLARRWASQGVAWVNARVRGSATADTPRVLPLPLVIGDHGDGGEGGGDPLLKHGGGGGGGGDGSARRADFNIDAISQSRGASFLRQASLVFQRSMLQQFRQAPSFALEMGVGFLAGGIMGSASTAVPTLYLGILKPPYTLISPAPMETLLPSVGLYVALAVGLAGSPAGVRTFGEEREVFYREASSGHDRLAYYLAKSAAMLPRLTAGAFHFASIFHFLATPSMSFETLFVCVWMQFYAVYGLAALTSMLVARENAALLGVITSLIAACMCGFG